MPLTDSQREKIEEGKWIHAYMIVEVQGNDKDYVKGALEGHVAKIKKEHNVEIYEEKYGEIKELSEKFYSHHAELKFIARDFNTLVHLALLYSPSVIEVYEPKQITVQIGDAQNILVDISTVVTSLAHAIFAQEGQLRKYRPAGEKGKSSP